MKYTFLAMAVFSITLAFICSNLVSKGLNVEIAIWLAFLGSISLLGYALDCINETMFHHEHYARKGYK